MNKLNPKILYYAEKCMMQQTGTKSLSMLNKMFINNENEISKYSVAAYLHFSTFAFKNSNKFKYSKLNDLLNEFNAEAFKKDDKKNKYKDALNIIMFESEKKENLNKNKDKFRMELIAEINSTNLSLNYIANSNSLKYSNLYNFLYKNDNKKLSLTNAAKLKLFFARLDNEVEKI